MSISEIKKETVTYYNFVEIFCVFENCLNNLFQGQTELLQGGRIRINKNLNIFHYEKKIKSKDNVTVEIDIIYNKIKNDYLYYRVSSKTPQGQILNDYGYAGTDIKGVLKSDIRAFNHFPLLILNDLPLDYHNALIKAFASRKVQRDRASKLLQDKQYLNIIHKGVKNIIIDIFK